MQEWYNAFKDGHYTATNLPKPVNTNHVNYTKALLDNHQRVFLCVGLQVNINVGGECTMINK